MASEPETTTIEVKMETWGALDRRKRRGDSFDDVIQRLINNSPVKMGQLTEGPPPNVEWSEIEHTPDIDAPCDHFDAITGPCESSAEYTRKYRHNGDDNWNEFHYCEGHAET